MNDNDITSRDALIAELRAALDDALNILVTYRHAGERHSNERINRTSAAILRGTKALCAADNAFPGKVWPR